MDALGSVGRMERVASILELAWWAFSFSLSPIHLPT